MLVLAIETSTPHTTVAIGGERGVLASTVLATGRANHEVVMPAITDLVRWSEVSLPSLAGIAVGLGPGLFTGMRVGIATAKTLSQVLSVPVVGLASLDVLAFSVRHSHRLICAAIDARRGEVFYAFYRPLPGGVARDGGFEVGSPAGLSAELEARGEAILLVGNGAIVYRRELEDRVDQLDFASTADAYPRASEMVELAVPRFQREEFDRLDDLVPHYVRKSDAEIAWDRRHGTG